jgi:hypothetical protein
MARATIHTWDESINRLRHQLYYANVRSRASSGVTPPGTVKQQPRVCDVVTLRRAARAIVSPLAEFSR